MSRLVLWLISSVALLLGALNYYSLTTRSGDAVGLPDLQTRVLQSGELRVGYLIYPPYLTKDAGRISGVFYDFTEDLGKNLGLKINWVEEVNLTNLSEGFKSDRYDMLAFPLWRNAARARAVDFSVPIFYSVVGVYVREDDKRFDGNLSLLNAETVRVAAIDGELAEDIARNSFPRAKIDAKPQLAGYEQLLLEVISRKADVTFYSRLFANRFIAANPNSIRDISSPSDPIRLYAECFLLPPGQYTFNSMINAALLELIENGGLDAALTKNGENPKEYFRRASPFQMPAK